MTEQYPDELSEVLEWFVARGGRARITELPQHLHDAFYYGQMSVPPMFGNNCGQCSILLHGRHILRQRGLPTKRTGRPSKGESGRDMLVIAALVRHHEYEPGGSIGNYSPATVRGLSNENPGLTTAAISRFFEKQFGKGRGHKGYLAACNKNARIGIGSLLAKWQGETPSFAPNLTDEDYGRRSDD